MLYDCVVSKTLGLLSTVATDDDESTDAVVSPLATGRTWLKRCSGYGSNLADWLTSSWLKVIEATRTVHAKVMMRLRVGCPLFWLRVEPG